MIRGKILTYAEFVVYKDQHMLRNPRKALSYLYFTPVYQNKTETFQVTVKVRAALIEWAVGDAEYS